jgi:hypothetical protein
MTILRMKSGRGTDLLPWILMALSVVIMGVAVGVYSSDASATDSASETTATPALGDAPAGGSASYGPVPDTSRRRTAPKLSHSPL